MTTSEDMAGQPWVVLLVDDEENVLKALRRVLRPLSARILTASNGVEAIDILEQEPVDLVLSDMRMPEMDGAQLLAEVARRWPDRARLLLTGQADLKSTIEAINKGHIERYLTKPWEDNDLRLSVGQAIEARRLRLEQMRRTIRIHQRNKELQKLSERLARQQKVETGTSPADGSIRVESVIQTLVGIMELRHRGLAEHCRRVGYWAQRIAQQMNLPVQQVESARRVGLLHDVGKIGLVDGLMGIALESTDEAERAQLLSHPELGQSCLRALDGLSEISVAVRAHHERFDGKGFPDRLAGDQIPIESRIAAVANEYDALLMGTLFEGRILPARAREFIRSHRGKRYDPQVVDAFEALLKLDEEGVEGVAESRRLSHQLREGMIVTRDLLDARGHLLVARGVRLVWPIIEHLGELERAAATNYVVYVRDERDS